MDDFLLYRHCARSDSCLKSALRFESMILELTEHETTFPTKQSMSMPMISDANQKVRKTFYFAESE